MPACPETSRCAFYNKYKNNPAARKAFIDTACANNWPCARKEWSKVSGKDPSPNFTPAGNEI